MHDHRDDRALAGDPPPEDGAVREGAVGEDDTALAELAAHVLGHLADPTRFALLRLLAVGEQDVNTLTAQVTASRSSVSQHLGRLRLAGLVATRRQGRRVLYTVTSDHLLALVAEAAGFAEHLRDGTPHHRHQPATRTVSPQ